MNFAGISSTFISMSAIGVTRWKSKSIMYTTPLIVYEVPHSFALGASNSMKAMR